MRPVENGGLGAGFRNESRRAARQAVRGLLAAAILLVWIDALSAQGGTGPASLADMVERVAPSVVTIKAVHPKSKSADGSQNSGKSSGDPKTDELFERFFGKDKVGLPDRPVLSNGSGFVFDAAGLIITAQSVVADATGLTVVLHDGTELEGSLVGMDARSDVAVVKVVPSGPLVPVAFMDSDKLRVGDWAVAMGNPFGLGPTVSVGLVSALNREVAGASGLFIQTDAAVNKGNSGGPLFTTDGQLMGMSTAIFSPSGGFAGISFAVPSALVRNVAAQLAETGEVRRGWLGVQIGSVSAELAKSLDLITATGALVASLVSGSPAEQAGLKSGDVIVEVDGAPVAGPADLSRRIGSRKPGEQVELLAVREGKPVKVAVVLGLLAPDTKAAAQENNIILGLTLGSSVPVPGRSEPGVQVTAVERDSAAAKSGLRAGDVLLAIGGVVVKEQDEIVSGIAAARQQGQRTISFRARSGEQERTGTLELGAE